MRCCYRHRRDPAECHEHSRPVPRLMLVIRGTVCAVVIAISWRSHADAAGARAALCGKVEPGWRLLVPKTSLSAERAVPLAVRRLVTLIDPHTNL